MNVAPVLTTFAAAAAAVAVGMAPLAAAESGVQYLGQPGELVDGTVTQHWTVSGLKPSTDDIPYRPVGRLWEASATDEAVAGSVVPLVFDLNARARSGDTYRVLFGVPTPQGVNPSPLAQGEKTTGKIYFDVTGENPDSVFYSAGGPELLLWVQAPPSPVPATSGRTPSSSAASAPADSGTAETQPASPTADPAGQTPAAAPTPAAVPAGSSGTPIPTGSAGTPLPAAAAPAETGPAPVPAALTPAPSGSSGTPLPQGSAGTPALSAGTPEPAPTPAAAPATTAGVPPPA